MLIHKPGRVIVSKPRKGDPAIDVEFQAFVNEAASWSKRLKNISLKDFRKSAKVFKKLVADIDDGIVERIQQSQGGQKGDRIKKQAIESQQQPKTPRVKYF